MQVLLLAFSLSLGLVLELIIGNQGFYVPVVGLVAFHFGVLRCYWQSLLWGCGVGVVLDLACGRSFPWYLVLIPLLVGLARVWRFQQLTHLLSLQAIPGFLSGFLCGTVHAWAALSGLEGLGWLDIRGVLGRGMTCGLCSALAFPLVCWLAEWGAYRLGIQRYSRVGSEYLSGSRGDDALEVLNVDD